jgi:predicted nucleic acid-binding protein
MASAVSDASVLIHLAGIGQLDLLPALFERVLVPEAVWREVVIQGCLPAVVEAVEVAARQGWLQCQSPTNAPLIQYLRQYLHQGEAEAIGLALEARPDVLLMDETDGRRRLYPARISTAGLPHSGQRIQSGRLLGAQSHGGLPVPLRHAAGRADTPLG